MALVFKIKFQDTLRRWLVTEDHNPAVFSLTMSQLEDKIREFFQLPLFASLVITYVDKDNDVVTLGDDQDLVDACLVQQLNPLRLDVQVSDATNGSTFAKEKGGLFGPLADSIWNPDAIVPPEADKGLGGLVAGTHIKRLLSQIRPALPYVSPLPSVRPHISHRGVQCDGCGMNPIEGPRFRSMKVPDYDLCASCYDLMGNETDFEKLEHPVSSFRRFGFFRRAPRPAGALLPTTHVSYGWKPECPFSEQASDFTHSNDHHEILSARFVKDVTIPDGTKMRPGTKFSKIWCMKNDGTVPWPEGTQLVHIGGDPLCSPGAANLELPEGGLSCGKDVDILIDFTAPYVVGHYNSHWRLLSPFGQKFGHRVWVAVHIVSDSKLSPLSQGNDENSAMPEAESQGHGSSEVDEKGFLSAPRERHDKKDSSNSIMIAPAGEGQEEKQSDMERELFVSEGIKDVEIFRSEDLTARLEDGCVFCGNQENQAVEEAKEDVELDGFSLVDRPTAIEADEGTVDQGRELLKKNNESMQRTAEGLSLCARWEGVMKNLKEMGFDDEAVIVPLLFKHNGSIKMVVKDLVQMEYQGGNGVE